MVRGLMFQGTGSGVGKSTVVAGLCRLLSRQGYKVKPFKPQNMSNNAAVAVDGGEIGRAQALQARACGIPSSIHMNPLLLKPQGQTTQIVLQGQAIASCSAREYLDWKPVLLPRVLESFYTLCQRETDIILIEGAGSPAEINLRAHDIANMGFAQAVDVPVVLIGDIERGGVIASLVGTHILLPPEERRRLRGYIINKFYGDPSLFTQGVSEISSRTRMECLGIVTGCSSLDKLPPEDTLDLPSLQTSSEDSDPIRIAIPRMPSISNFDEFDPLRLEKGVEISVIQGGRLLPLDVDLIILPGSKSTIQDLEFLRRQGWDQDLRVYHRHGGVILGLCGGFQMLGRRITDPAAVESPMTHAYGLGLLDSESCLSQSKTVTKVQGWHCLSELPVQGYEIHCGQTTYGDGRPFLRLTDPERLDGVVSDDGRILGSYVHGLFENDSFRQYFLSWLHKSNRSLQLFDQTVENALDEWADHLERSLDIGRLLDLAQPLCDS